MRPELLTDETLGGLSDATVLFYLKLWLLTDDAGFFEWRPRMIGATLYQYRGSRQRERQVEAWLGELVGEGRIAHLDCGLHGLVPTIPKYRIQGGNLSFSTRDRHARDCDLIAQPGRPQPPAGKSASNVVKEAVVARDQDHCRYCGRPGIVGRTLVFEHVDNLGPAVLENIVLACRSCNVRKGSGTTEAAGMVLLEPPPPATGVRTGPYSGRTSQAKYASDSVSVSVSESGSVAPAREAPPASARGAGGARRNGIDPVTREEWALIVGDPAQPVALRAEARKAMDAIDKRREVDDLFTPKEH